MWKGSPCTNPMPPTESGRLSPDVERTEGTRICDSGNRLARANARTACDSNHATLLKVWQAQIVTFCALSAPRTALSLNRTTRYASRSSLFSDRAPRSVAPTSVRFDRGRARSIALPPFSIDRRCFGVVLRSCRVGLPAFPIERRCLWVALLAFSIALPAFSIGRRCFWVGRAHGQSPSARARSHDAAIESGAALGQSGAGLGRSLVAPARYPDGVGRYPEIFGRSHDICA